MVQNCAFVVCCHSLFWARLRHVILRQFVPLFCSKSGYWSLCKTISSSSSASNEHSLWAIDFEPSILRIRSAKSMLHFNHRISSFQFPLISWILLCFVIIHGSVWTYHYWLSFWVGILTCAMRRVCTWAVCGTKGQFIVCWHSLSKGRGSFIYLILRPFVLAFRCKT